MEIGIFWWSHDAHLTADVITYGYPSGRSHARSPGGEATATRLILVNFRHVVSHMVSIQPQGLSSNSTRLQMHTTPGRMWMGIANTLRIVIDLYFVASDRCKRMFAIKYH